MYVQLVSYKQSETPRACVRCTLRRRAAGDYWERMWHSLSAPDLPAGSHATQDMALLPGLDKDAKPSKAAKRKARKERVLDNLEARGVVLDHDARCQVTQRRIDQRATSHEVVDLCDDELEDMDSGVPLPQEAGPSQVPWQVQLEPAPAGSSPPPPPQAPLQVRWADAAPGRDEPAVACTSEYAEYAGAVSEALHPGGGKRTREPSQEDEAIEPSQEDEAQFSDAEEGPPTPSAATRSATLEEENGSFALSGVVSADAWQAGGIDSRQGEGAWACAWACAWAWAWHVHGHGHGHGHVHVYVHVHVHACK